LRIAVTADLHYDHSDASRRATEGVAQEMCSAEADAVVIAGDTFSRDATAFEACLKLFESFEGVKCVVAGNHDLWVNKGGDSLAVYEDLLPSVAARCGFHYLDRAPLVLDGTALVGNAGWYDYSFSDPNLGMPRRFYELKLGPRVAAMLGATRHMVGDMDDIQPDAQEVSCVWNDGRFVRWPHTDEAFTEQLADRLGEHLAAVEPRVKSIVCVTHHLPFENMVKRHSSPNYAFSNAFMGSPLLGERMLACRKVKYAVCGHSHRKGRFSNGHIECINVGSTYETKHFEVIQT